MIKDEISNKDMTITGYKFLTDSMKSPIGNVIWEMGIWKQQDNPPKLCVSGFHACRTPLESLGYRWGDRWVVVEAGGEIIDDEDKFVCTKMRIIRELPLVEIMQRFAIACVKNSIFRFEHEFPDDDRPRKALEFVESIASGKITEQKAKSLNRMVEAQAESAARIANRGAARSAAKAASWLAESRGCIVRSLYASSVWAARSAACSAWSKGTSTAGLVWDAELNWQNRILEKIIREY